MPRDYTIAIHIAFRHLQIEYLEDLLSTPDVDLLQLSVVIVVLEDVR